MEIALKPCFGHPLLDVMNFLNEVVLRHPGAISFAPGRPTERHFDVAGSLAKAPAFVAWRARQLGWSEPAVWNDLGQYNKTNGILNDLVARQLREDEGIAVEPQDVMVTQGAQEAMVILLLGLFTAGEDVLLASDPAYIGITGLAAIAGIETVPVAMDEEGLGLEAVQSAIAAARSRGKRPRALYHVPDFNNPLGTRMALDERRRLLGLLRDEGVLLFEDNPYGMFVFDGEPLPTLKALDEDGVVIYLGSFAKTLYPGLRLGYLVADQKVAAPDGNGKQVPLAVELSKVKSLTTVNTSPLLQAVAGAILLENDCSLRRVVAAKLPFYRGNRDRMLAELERELGGVAGVSWNRPAGGFFLTVELPFVFGDAEVEICARDHGVIVCPLSYFALLPGREKQVRLSFSYVEPPQVTDGIARFAAFVRERAARA